ncbi:MAG TPA: metal-sulfur cluster assembly factor [Thermodesulfobacteriota bacterium]
MSARGGPDPAEVLAALRAVIDPEIGLDIVSLGLVYDVRVDGGSVTVTMTLTAAGCPLGAAMRDGVTTVVGALPGVETVDVRIVWDPPWSPDMIDPAALGTL